MSVDQAPDVSREGRPEGTPIRVVVIGGGIVGYNAAERSIYGGVRLRF